MIDSREIEQKMTQLFKAVFPELADTTEEIVEKAERDALETWDSANHILLITVLEEEFGISVPDGSAADIRSFQNAVTLVKGLKSC